MNYWLFKTEPNTFSYDTLDHSPNHTAPWDGVRNYQARNFLRDSISVGDQVFIYHSSIAEPAIVGIATVTKAGYPDFTAWDSANEHFDPKSTIDQPIWFMVDLQARRKLAHAVSLRQLKNDPELRHMSLFTRPRLSIHPITTREWNHVVALSKREPKSD